MRHSYGLSCSLSKKGLKAARERKRIGSAALRGYGERLEGLERLLRAAAVFPFRPIGLCTKCGSWALGPCKRFLGICQERALL